MTLGKFFTVQQNLLAHQFQVKNGARTFIEYGQASDNKTRWNGKAKDSPIGLWISVALRRRWSLHLVEPWYPFSQAKTTLLVLITWSASLGTHKASFCEWLPLWEWTRGYVEACVHCMERIGRFFRSTNGILLINMLTTVGSVRKV